MSQLKRLREGVDGILTSDDRYVDIISTWPSEEVSTFYRIETDNHRPTKRRRVSKEENEGENEGQGRYDSCIAGHSLRAHLNSNSQTVIESIETSCGRSRREVRYHHKSYWGTSFTWLVVGLKAAILTNAEESKLTKLKVEKAVSLSVAVWLVICHSRFT